MNDSLQMQKGSKESAVEAFGPFSRIALKWLDNANGLCLLLILSFALKIALYLMTDVISNDGPRYINQAVMFLEGDWRAAVESDATFLYSLMIAAFGRMGFDLVQAGQIISLIASVLVLVPLYLLFRGIIDGRVAFLGCLAFIVSPSMNKFSVSVMRDPLFLFVFAWLAYFVWRVTDEAKIRYFVAILVLSLLAPLLRLEGLLIVPIILTYFFVKIVYQQRSSKPVMIAMGLLLVALIAVFFSDYLPLDFSSIRQQRVQQILTSVNLIKNNGFFKPNPVLGKKLKEMESSIPGGSARNDFAEISSDHIRVIYFIGLISVLVDDIWLPFFVVFVFGLTRLRISVKDAIFVSIFTLSYLSLAFFFNINYGFLDERYVYIPVMLMFIGVGVGLDRLFSIICRFSYPKVAALFFVIFFFGAPVAQALKDAAKPEAISSRLAGEWLASRPGLQNLSMIANGEKIPFYAGRRRNFVSASFIMLPSLEEMAINNKIDLITIELRNSNLLNLPGFTGYNLIAKFEDPRHVALIYQRTP